jgi:hypothetical protein
VSVGLLLLFLTIVSPCSLFLTDNDDNVPIVHTQHFDAAMAPPREEYDHAALATLWVFTLITLALIITRLIWRYRRRIPGESFFAAPEDLWMALSALPLLLRLVFIHISLLYLTAHFDRSKYPESSMSPTEIRHRTIGSKVTLPGRICYAGFLWMMKVVILLWFEKVTGNIWPYNAAIRSMYVLLGLTFVGVIMVTFLECRPVHLYWQVFPDPGNCVQAKMQLLVMGAMNMFVPNSPTPRRKQRLTVTSVTDMALIIIPLPLVIGARLPMTRKFQLVVLFSVSLFVISITVIRMPIIIGDRILQKSRSLWASIGLPPPPNRFPRLADGRGYKEVMTACLVANAPVLNSLLHHTTRKHTNYQQNEDPGSDESSVSRQRRRVVQMPVTGQNSFGSLTRNNGLDEGKSITINDVEQQQQQMQLSEIRGA